MRQFEDLPWHDAILLSIEIDRRQAGVADEIRIAMRWPDGQRSTITFLDCYGLMATMNFGVVAEDTVSLASQRDDGPAVQQHRVTWAKLGVDLASLRQFTIETSSTASTIVVLALGWEERLDA